MADDNLYRRRGYSGRTDWALVIVAFFSFASTCVTGWVAYQVAEIGVGVDKVHTAVNSERTESLRRERQNLELIADLKTEIRRIDKENVKLEEVERRPKLK